MSQFWLGFIVGAIGFIIVTPIALFAFFLIPVNWDLRRQLKMKKEWHKWWERKDK